MELDAFCTRLGQGQGRVELPPGEVCFVLGDAEEGRWFDVAAGDFAEVSQVTDLTGVTLVRATGSIRAPASLPAAFAWEASIVVDGVKLCAARCGGGQQRSIGDLAANVSKIAGMHVVAVRLQLVSV